MSHSIKASALLMVQREKEHGYDEAVGIAYSRGVENESRLEQVEHMIQGNISIKIGIRQHENQSADSVTDIRPKQIPQERGEIA